MHSIKWRFVLPFTIIIAAVTVALMVFFTNTYRSMYYADTRDRLTAEAQLLAAEINQISGDTQFDNTLQDIAARFATQLQSRVTVLRPDGVVVAESELDPLTMENHLNRPEIQQVLTGETGYNIRYSTTRKIYMIYIAVPQEQDGSLKRIVRLAKPLTIVENRVKNIRLLILGTGLLTVLATFLITWLTAKRTVDPIINLTRSADRIANGDFSQIPTPGRDNEVTNLTRAFAKMADQIQDQMSTVTKEKTKLETILDRLMDGVILVDQGGKILLMNDAASAILGVSANVKEGVEFVSTIHLYQVIDLWQRTRKERSDHEVSIDDPGSQKFLFAMSTFVGTSEGIVLILIQDRTKVHQLEVMRRNFVSNVSHELRTPLTTLKTLNDTVQVCVREQPEDADHFLSLMDVEIDKLTQMVLELLDLSRIESGRLEMKKQLVDIYALLGNAASRMEAQAKRASVALKVVSGDQLPMIPLDGEQMERVLINLIHNAIRFTPVDGEISLSAEIAEKDILIKVKDTGEGISEEDLPRIFERFYKTDQARSSGGTGLGLSIAKHIVEAHRGKIWAESINGSGAIFFISIPL